MSAILNTWKNTKGETVIEHATGLTVLPRGQTVAQFATQERERQAGQVVQARVAGIRRKVAMPENHGVIASVNAETGELGSAVVLPSFRLSDARRAVLEQEAKALRIIVDDPQSTIPAKKMARETLRHIERLLELDGQSRPPTDQRPEKDRKAARTDTGQR